MKIEVMGDSGDRCERLHENAVAAMRRLGRLDLIVRVRDPDEIAARGVWKTPALAIDGQVEIIDAVPGETDLVSMFERHIGEDQPGGTMH
ncbi:thioredoxin family protein [bacterium]|nr:thioredoxin family protein [bacterium]